ncbi:MAG: hypothetical protein ACQGVK_01815 [Myxococcota bacterium]
MHIKRFEAPDWPSALKRVREEFGPDALVLSSKEVRRRSKVLGWMARPQVEIVAAVDRSHRPGRATRSAGRSAEGVPDRGLQLERKQHARWSGASAAAEAPSESPGVAPDPSWNGLLVSRSLIEPIESEVRALRRSVDSVRASHEDADRLREELHALRRTLRSLAESRAEAAGDTGLAARLHAAGLSQAHSESLAGEAAECQRRHGGNEVEHLRDVLVQRLDPVLAPPRPDRDPPLHLVIGAPGVGKTTTVAKSAGRLGRRGPVALVSADSARIGADAPLRGYARSLGVPFSRVTSADGLAKRIAHRGARQVWVDTPGLGRRDPDAMGELRKLRAALGDHARVELVVSATTKESDLRAEIELHRPLAPDALVVTRWDESDEISNVVNLLLDSHTPPVSWLGTGQAVPSDLVVPDPADVAGRLLGGLP